MGGITGNQERATHPTGTLKLALSIVEGLRPATLTAIVVCDIRPPADMAAPREWLRLTTSRKPRPFLRNRPQCGKPATRLPGSVISLTAKALVNRA